MNKRMQELIDRYTSLWPEIDYYGNGVYTTQVDTEGLVEAVVRECADVCNKQSLHYFETVGRGGESGAAETLSYLIKSHFGVE